FDWRGLEIGVGARNLAAAGQRDDASAMPCGVERQDEVDHGQARAHKEHRPLSFDQLAHRGLRLIAPGVVDVPFADFGKWAEGFGLLVTDRERERPGPHHPTVIQGNVPYPLGAMRLEDGRAIDVGMPKPDHMLENPAQVTAEQAALGKSASIAAFRLEMADEMLG